MGELCQVEWLWRIDIVALQRLVIGEQVLAWLISAATRILDGVLHIFLS